MLVAIQQPYLPILRHLIQAIVYVHIAIYLLVSAILLLTNLVSLFIPPWSIVPISIWGIVLGVHILVSVGIVLVIDVFVGQNESKEDVGRWSVSWRGGGARQLLSSATKGSEEERQTNERATTGSKMD